MEEEKRYSYKWMYAGLSVWFIVAAFIMVRFGIMATEMPDAAKELNALMSKKVRVCSGDHASKECAKAVKTLKDFQKKWFASNKFKAVNEKPE